MEGYSDGWIHGRQKLERSLTEKERKYVQTTKSNNSPRSRFHVIVVPVFFISCQPW